jgi:glycosyltransferase involved in cell wall biosynthesis
MKDNHRLVDFEFTLALNNATGKYFVCRDVIEGCGDLIEKVWYWRLPMKQLPARTLARVLGRLAVLEINFRLKLRSSAHLPLIHNSRPLVFSDPREVILYALKSRDVVLCHDMGPLTHPELYHPSVKRTYETAFEKIRKAKPLLVFVSECSLKNFVTLYGDDYPFMKLIYPALRMGIDSGEEEPIAAAPRRFLLTVGSVGSRKNHLRSLEAFALSGLTELGYHYVICGGPEPGFDTVVESAGKAPAVILSGYVNDSELRWLYAHASGFVLPSLLEGFGLPAAEAIARDLVPLVSRGGALHEIAGDSAILVDPLNVNEIANGMRQLALMGQEERQSRLVELRRSFARFSRQSAVEAWRATLQQALAI